MSNPPQKNEEALGSEFVKLIPSLILAGAVAFITSWWNTQLTQNELRLRLDRMEEKAKENAGTIAESAKQGQNNTIKMAEINVTLQNAVEQIRRVEAEHQQRKTR